MVEYHLCFMIPPPLRESPAVQGCVTGPFKSVCQLKWAHISVILINCPPLDEVCFLQTHALHIYRYACMTLWALDFSSASLLELFDQIDKYIYLCLKIIKILFVSGTTEDLLFSVLWFVSLFMTHLASTLCFVSPSPVSLYYDWGNRLERKKEFSWGNSQRSATHWCSKSNSKKAAEPTEAHEVWTSYRRPPRMNWS